MTIFVELDEKTRSGIRERAAELIERHGLSREAYARNAETGMGMSLAKAFPGMANLKLCAVGALHLACRERLCESVLKDVDFVDDADEVLDDVWEFAELIMRENGVENNITYCEHDLATWNDEPDRTVEEVARLFRGQLNTNKENHERERSGTGHPPAG